MIKVLTTVCMSVAITIATVFPTASTGFGQEKVISLPAESVTAKADKSPAPELWRQVEVIRTAHGVPHIRARNLRAAGYALAWLQSEDYGTVTPMELLEASGRWAWVAGYERIESDFLTRRHRQKMLENYHLLSKETRDVYEGFAAGVNRYIELHPEHFPPRMPTDFNGHDVAALEVTPPSVRKVRAFVARLNPPPAPERPGPPENAEGEKSSGDEGSN